MATTEAGALALAAAATADHDARRLFGEVAAQVLEPGAAIRKFENRFLRKDGRWA